MIATMLWWIYAAQFTGMREKGCRTLSGNTSGTHDVDQTTAGRNTAEVGDGAAHAEMVRQAREREVRLLAASPWFDSQWYIKQYPDVDAAGVDPVDHFVFFGWKERRNPSTYFHTDWYLTNNPDVDQAELNPLVHFIEHGEAENRLPNPDGISPRHVQDLVPATTIKVRPTDDLANLDEVMIRESEDITILQSSSFFDAGWYATRYPEVSTLDFPPEVHYLRFGGLENYDPSPRFRSAWYLSTYTDVADIGLNPLIHFLRYGQAEGRKAMPATDAKSAVARNAINDTSVEIDAESDDITIREREDVALLKSSPFFDAEWYADKYPQAATHGMTPERHYLHIGAFDDHDPSPRFRSAWYLATYADVADNRLNPLIHFLRYGQAEGRKATPKDGIMAAALSPDDSASAAQTAAGDAQSAIDAIKPKPGHLLVSLQGHTMGMVPQDWTVAPPEPLQALLAMALLHGWDDRVAIDLRPALKTSSRRELPPFLVWNFTTLAAFKSAGAYVADGWFAGDHDLRLRIEPQEGGEFIGTHLLRFHQSDAAGMAMCGESLLRDYGPTFIDVKFANPYKPLLITVTDEAGVLVDSALIPFPSLLRGGAHHAEVVAMGERAARMVDLIDLSDGLFREAVNWDDDATPFSIARIDIDLRGALGSERIFDPLVCDWLADIFKLGISTINPDSVTERRVRSNMTKTLAARDERSPAIVQAMTDRRLAGHTTLVVPHDSLPTLAVLASRRLSPTGADPVSGCFLTADATTGRPNLSVSIPTLPALDRMQPNRVTSYPRLVPKSANKKPAANPIRHCLWPLAIRFINTTANQALTFLPHAPDASTPPLKFALAADERARTNVVAIVSAQAGLAALERMLPSLAAQTDAANLHVVVAIGQDMASQSTKIERLLGALFPNRYTVANCRSMRPAAQMNEAVLAASPDTTHLLFIDAAMVLHDPRTLDTLLALATRDGVASVGCPHVRQMSDKDRLTVSAGAYFPVRLSLNSNPGVMFEEPRTPTIMVHATLPVAANNLRLAMVSFSVWQKLGGLTHRLYPIIGGDIEFGLKAAAKGHIHLNTSAITVTDSASRPGSMYLDVLASSYLPAQSWQDIASGITLVRELR